MARPAKIKQNGIITYEVCPGCGAEVGVLHGKIDGEHCKLYWCECDNGRGLLAIAPGCSCTQQAAEHHMQFDQPSAVGNVAESSGNNQSQS